MDWTQLFDNPSVSIGFPLASTSRAVRKMYVISCLPLPAIVAPPPTRTVAPLARVRLASSGRKSGSKEKLRWTDSGEVSSFTVSAKCGTAAKARCRSGGISQKCQTDFFDECRRSRVVMTAEIETGTAAFPAIRCLPRRGCDEGLAR